MNLQQTSRDFSELQILIVNTYLAEYDVVTFLFMNFRTFFGKSEIKNSKVVKINCIKLFHLIIFFPFF